MNTKTLIELSETSTFTINLLILNESNSRGLNHEEVKASLKESEDYCLALHNLFGDKYDFID